MRILFAIFLFELSVTASDLASLQLRVDTWITNNITAITSSQTSFRAANPHYFQGRLTHTSIPSHTDAADGDAPADKLAVHPGDQAESWLDVMPFLDGQAMPAALRIDIYKGQQGQGWVLIAFIKHNGVTYNRSIATGLEADMRNAGWGVYD